MFKFLRKNNHYSSDSENYYFSKSNSFYCSNHADWKTVGSVIKDAKLSPIQAAKKYKDMKLDEAKDFGKLILKLMLFVVNAFADNEEKALSISKAIIDNDELRFLDEHDKRYILLLISGTLHNHFKKIPKNMVGMRVYKPDMKKVHPELKKIFLLNLDDVKFQTE